MDKYEKITRNLLDSSEIEINGKNPWDIQVHNKKTYKRLFTDAPIGLGESYMDGWWDSDQLDETIARIFRARIDRMLKKNPAFLFFLLKNKLLNVASANRAYTVGKKHYDFGNELFEAMLDPQMNYSCGYWKNAQNLEKAQLAKLELICQKLYLKPGMKILDIGCGWGNFAKYAAAKYGAKVIGLTVSKEQAVFARKRCDELPVKILIQDYRSIKTEKFDRVISIEMLEHVTYKNYATFMTIVNSCLKDDGLFLLQVSGLNFSVIAGDPWHEKYIFPNSHLPSIAQIGRAAEDKLIIEDLHNFSGYYYLTLMEWLSNFEKNWKFLSAKYPEKYNQRFYRMWKFYLESNAGTFKARYMALWQIVFSKSKVPTVYQAVR